MKRYQFFKTDKELVFSVFAVILLVVTINQLNVYAEVIYQDTDVRASETGVDRNKNEWTTRLDPAQVRYIDPNPGITQPEKDAIKSLALFEDWTINNGAGVPGQFRVIKHDAFVSMDRMAGASSNCDPRVPDSQDCFTMQYVGNPGRNLYWLQLVCTNAPPTRDKTCTTDWSKSYTDGAPAALLARIPFWLTLEQNRTITQKDASGTVTFTFKDKPARDFPAVATSTINWKAHLYLVEWDGRKTVTVHNGTEWGFSIGCASQVETADRYRSGGVDSNADQADTEIRTVITDDEPNPGCTVDFETFVSLQSQIPTLGLMNISPDQKILYVVDSGTNELVVVDATQGPSFNEIKRVKVGTDPRDVAVAQGGKKLYVTNHMSNTVSVIDVNNDYQVSKTIPVDYLPWGIGASNDGKKVFVANWGGKGATSTSDEEKGTVTVIDTATDIVVKTINIPSTDDGGPWGMKSHPNKNWLVVTNDGTETITLIHRDTYEVKEIDLKGLGCVNPWDPEITDEGKIIVACGDGTTFFPVIQVFCPDDFEFFEQCEIDASKKLEFDGESTINEPWAVYAKGDKIYGVDMYNTAPSGEEQEEGSLLIWDADTFQLLEEIEHEHYPEVVGVAPLDVLVTDEGTIFVSSVSTHEISNKMGELAGKPLKYPTEKIEMNVDKAEIDGTKTSIDYAISGGSLDKIIADDMAKSLVVSVTSDKEGELILRLPMTVIDAVSPTDAQTDLTVLVNGKESDSHEIKRIEERILSISIPEGATQVEIVGTKVIPEFPVAALVLILGVITTVLMGKKWMRF